MFNPLKIKNDIVSWIQGYFNNNGIDSPAVVGISGGKDSSVVAALCVQALGADRVYGVLMPYGEQYDINISREVVTILNIKHCTVNIKDSVDTFLASIAGAGLSLNQQSRVNAPARIRMAVLYAISASLNGRVANTCNLSEDYVGYSTKFGDAAGDFSPLSRLTSAEVKAVGRALGLPSFIIDKTPEDGLTGRTDEENLGFTYDVLDRYIRDGVCENLEIKAKIDALHKQNLHKLSPMPCFEYIP